MENKIINEGTLPINGIGIYYKIIGEGKPVIILHGGPGLGHNYLYPHIKQLANKYQVIFYDQRSSGKSSGHESPLDITIDNFVEDLEGFREALKIEQLNLMGHSWGGLLAQNYAIKHPQRIKTMILLASMGPNAAFTSDFKNTIQDRLTDKTKKALKKLGNTFKSSEKIADTFIEYYTQSFKAYFYDADLIDQLDLSYFSEEMVGKHLLCNTCLFNYQQNYDLSGLLKSIDCPTLIIHGDYDPISFQAARALHKAISASEFLLLQNCGHFSHIEKPDQTFNAIYDFLSRHGVREY